MAEKFAVMNPKHFCHPDAARKVRALAEFYSEDLSKADDVVDEFVTFRTMYRDVVKSEGKKAADTQDRV